MEARDGVEVEEVVEDEGGEVGAEMGWVVVYVGGDLWSRKLLGRLLVIGNGDRKMYEPVLFDGLISS